MEYYFKHNMTWKDLLLLDMRYLGISATFTVELTDGKPSEGL